MDLDMHYNAAKDLATHKIKQTKDQIKNFKNKLFNMDLPKHIEIILRNRIRFLTLFSGFVALVTLFIMFKEPVYLKVSLITGLVAMVIDYFIEYHGISNSEWDYPTTHLSFRKVPLEVPLLFFNCGILATYAFYFFSTQLMVNKIITPEIVGLSYVQIALILIGVFFLFKYISGAVKSLVFWMLPFGIALYLSFSQPWVLVFSIFPMYIDYYLEKRLVKTAHIKYDKYGEAVATNVAISYFSTTLFILGVVAVLVLFFTT